MCPVHAFPSVRVPTPPKSPNDNSLSQQPIINHRPISNITIYYDSVALGERFGLHKRTLARVKILDDKMRTEKRTEFNCVAWMAWSSMAVHCTARKSIKCPFICLNFFLLFLLNHLKIASPVPRVTGFPYISNVRTSSACSYAHSTIPFVLFISKKKNRTNWPAK